MGHCVCDAATIQMFCETSAAGRQAEGAIVGDYSVLLGKSTPKMKFKAALLKHIGLLKSGHGCKPQKDVVI